MHVHTNTHVHEHTHRNQHTHTYTHTHAQSLLPTDRVNLKCRSNVALHTNAAQKTFVVLHFGVFVVLHLCAIPHYLNISDWHHFWWKKSAFWVQNKSKHFVFLMLLKKAARLNWLCFGNVVHNTFGTTGWRRPIGCLKLQVIFGERATKYRALLRKMIYEDKISYDSTPPCSICALRHPVVYMVLQEINKKTNRRVFA